MDNRVKQKTKWMKKSSALPPLKRYFRIFVIATTGSILILMALYKRAELQHIGDGSAAEDLLIGKQVTALYEDYRKQAAPSSRTGNDHLTALLHELTMMITSEIMVEKTSLYDFWISFRFSHDSETLERIRQDMPAEKDMEPVKRFFDLIPDDLDIEGKSIARASTHYSEYHLFTRVHSPFSGYFLFCLLSGNNEEAVAALKKYLSLSEAYMNSTCPDISYPEMQLYCLRHEISVLFTVSVCLDRGLIPESIYPQLLSCLKRYDTSEATERLVRLHLDFIHFRNDFTDRMYKNYPVRMFLYDIAVHSGRSTRDIARLFNERARQYIEKGNYIFDSYREKQETLSRADYMNHFFTFADYDKIYARSALFRYLKDYLSGRNSFLPHSEYSLSSDPVREAMLCFDRGDLERAEQLCKKQLGFLKELDYRFYGKGIHTTHLVLGRIALKNGNVADAEKHLLASTDISGSPALSSFGPSMLLAKELLEAGKKDAVLQYLDRVLSFWDEPEKVNAWKAEITSGKTPDFGANLQYQWDGVGA